jgi:hypothetical protein
MVRIINRKIAERQQAIIFDLIFLSLKLTTQECLPLLPRALLDCLLLPLAARSARYCSSGSTPINGRLELCVTGWGRLIDLCISRRLFGVMGLEVTGAWVEETTTGDDVELGLGTVAGAVAARER